MLGQAAFRRAFHRRRSEPADLGVVRRILLVRTDKIGDAVVSTPVFEALRRKFPAAQIDVLLGVRNRAIAPLLPFIDNALVSAGGVRPVIKMLGQLRRQRYDVAIDLLAADSVSSALFTIGSRARIKIGFEDSTSGLYEFVIPRPPEPSAFVPKLLRLLAPLHITVPDAAAQPSVRLSPEAMDVARQAVAAWGPRGRGLVLVNISASSPKKFWGVEAYADLAGKLRDDGFLPVLVSAPGDREKLTEIATRSGARFLPPRPSLAEFAAVLSFADLIVSPDTSIIHIAAALGKPVVALFGSAYSAAQWTPWGVPNRTLSSETSVRDISGAAVLEAARSLAVEALTT
jgi:ADP-heptose:LPS heptosyltransferase